jgi:hypothetical protein
MWWLQARSPPILLVVRYGRNNPEVNKFIVGLTALGRVGLPDDIGGVLAKPIGTIIASLLSEDNKWVNAQRIEVSGGQLI